MSRLHYRLSSTLQLINDWDLDLCQACNDLSRNPSVRTTFNGSAVSVIVCSGTC